MDRLSPERRETIRRLLDGYSSLSTKKLSEPLSPDFTHHILPSSLDMPSRNKDEFALCAAGIFSIFEDFKMMPTNIYEDNNRDVVVIHARMRATPRKRINGAKQLWDNECVLIVQLSKDGKQVTRLEEFVDSVMAVEMRKKHGTKFSLTVSDSKESLVRNAVVLACLAAGSIMGVRWLLDRFD